MKITSIRDITKIATAGTLYSPACNLYKLSVKDTGGSPIDLSTEDNATNTLNGTISAATQAAPGVITTSAAHGLTTGDQVLIRDVQGMTEINGTFTVIVTGATTFNITYGGTSTSSPDQRIDTSGFGAYTTGGTFTSGEIAIGTVEAIVRELNPMAYFTVADTSGVMYLIMDQNVNSASDLQARVRKIGIDNPPATTTSIGPNDIDISGSTVEDVTVIEFTV